VVPSHIVPKFTLALVRCVVKEVVIAINGGTPEEQEKFFTELRTFLQNPLFKTLQFADLETVTVATGLPTPETRDDQEELAVGSNWVMNCRIAPSPEDES
jgi:hypothetical protein